MTFKKKHLLITLSSILITTLAFSTEQVRLRSSSKDLSVSQVQSMPNMSIRKMSGWCFYGHSTIVHDYEPRTINGDIIVIDNSTGLMWHQSGSSKSVKFAIAKQMVGDLNNRRYAGYDNWRLPTVEEAASLLESNKTNDLYIDPVFDSKQLWIWTNDRYGSDRAWFVYFRHGCVEWNCIGFGSHVRPVRSMK